MPDEDEKERRARARQLREELERIRRPADPEEDRPSPPARSPREFTDEAASHAASEGVGPSPGGNTRDPVSSRESRSTDDEG